jgi:hypothetical protein
MPSRAVGRRCAAWTSRVVLAVLFAFGMLGSATRPLFEGEAESEPVVEIGEDGETVAREEELYRVSRRHAARGGPRWARPRVRLRPPAKLEPTVDAPTRPGWQRPRRAPPPSDDDDIAIG